MIDQKLLEQEIFKTGSQLLKHAEKHNSKFFKKNWWYKKMLSWTIKDPLLKTQLFRFIDVLPRLSTDEQFLSHFKEYFKGHELEKLSSGLSHLAPSLMVKNIKSQIHQVAKMFIAGSQPKEVVKILSQNWDNNLSYSLDILGEATVSEFEANHYLKQYLFMIDFLVSHQKNWPEKKQLTQDLFGAIPAVNFSVKASSVFSQIKTEAWDNSKQEIKNRLRILFKKAVTNCVFINLDMEQYHHKDLFLELFKELLMEEEFKTYPHFGIVVQSYLKDSLKDLQQLDEFAKQRGEKITIRLVKGAYWDTEVLLARQKNWPIPVYTNKEETDCNFENCIKWVFEHSKGIKLAIGSHNARSIACALAWHKLKPGVGLEFQVLYGMGEALADFLKQQGYCVRFYCTMGELIPGMSYFVRRLLENSSSQSFVLDVFLEKQSAKNLLAPPKLPIEDKNKNSNNLTNNTVGDLSNNLTNNKNNNTASDTSNNLTNNKNKITSNKNPDNLTCDKNTFNKQKLKNIRLSKLVTFFWDKKKLNYNKANSYNQLQASTRSFVNYPLLDFSQKSNRDNFQQALDNLKTQFPFKVPIIIEGQELKSPKVFTRKNPSNFNQTISHSFFANTNQAEQAINSISVFYKEWKQVSPLNRVACLKKLAQLITKKEFELAALQVFEIGKTWGEAQADIAEAIDFCNYYADCYQQLIEKQKTDEVSGEESFSHFEAIGPTAVIAPWNFPLAILTGMTVAPLLCGNTVAIKPSEHSSLTAFEFAKLLLQSGFPEKSFAFLPGEGPEIGSYLVKHPKISIISFTGSFKVGSQILKSAGEISKQQKDIKKCIIETGGKNAIIIDSSADLDTAIEGVLQSAFGFQGQKCSACSRVIVLQDTYPAFIKRFLPAVKSLVIDNPEQPHSSLGPLIDKSAYERIKKLAKEKKSEKLFEGSIKESLNTGWFCPPLVYLIEEETSPLFQEEFFAPLLAILKVKDLKTAIRKANNVRFGLTAGLYSRHPKNIETAKSLIEVGNFYINRNCVGAMVKRHPFGGRKMSGLGSKAGGPEYLKQFLHTKIVTENTIRRGFAPEIFKQGF